MSEVDDPYTDKKAGGHRSIAGHEGKAATTGNRVKAYGPLRQARSWHEAFLSFFRPAKYTDVL